MSVPFQIEAVFDGATDFSLANPTEIVAGSQIRRYVPAGQVGVVDIQSLPNLAFSPLWIWAMSLSVSGGAGTVQLRLQNGTLLPLIDTALSVDPCWNILLPQGSDLVVDVDDGGPAAGVLYWQFLGVASDDWNKLQCCHKFAPDLFVG